MENEGKMPTKVSRGGRAEEHKMVTTYVEDMAKVIEGDQAGIIKKIIHEQEASEREKINLSPESKKNKIFMATSAVMVIIAASIAYYFLWSNEINTIEVPEPYVPLIYLDGSYFQEVGGMKKGEIAQSIENEVRNTRVKGGGVEGIYAIENKKLIGLRRFSTLIEGNLDLSSKNPNAGFVSDDFLLGVVNEGPETKNFFMLIKVRSMLDAFGSMRAWEEKMFSDLHGFFGITVETANKYLLTKPFDDVVIENKNARVLYDNEGNTVFLYVFADDASIVITDGREAVEELILRLGSSRIRK